MSYIFTGLYYRLVDGCWPCSRTPKWLQSPKWIEP